MFTELHAFAYFGSLLSTIPENSKSHPRTALLATPLTHLHVFQETPFKGRASLGNGLKHRISPSPHKTNPIVGSL
jgi:hypothetical protein